MPSLNNTRSPRREKRDRNSGVRRHRLAAVVDRGTCTHAVMTVQRVAFKFLKPGTVVRVHVEYAEKPEGKARPCIVVSKAGHEVVVVPCSSSTAGIYAGDVVLNDLPPAGLTRWTKARTGKTTRVAASACIDVMGHLSEHDLVRVLAERKAA